MVFARSASSVVADDKGEIPVLDVYCYCVCPWCNKLKAFLDYHQLPYRHHEVNPWSKKEIAFSADYKKVPIVIMEGQQINDSSEIIQMLGEAMLASGGKYRSTAIAEGTGQGGVQPDKMREVSTWAAEDLVRALTCSIYRTPSESMQAMEYVISHPGFSWYEKAVNQYVGGGIMYLISKRMKKKYGITDERESVYKAVQTWLSEVGDRKFLGGDMPCRVDLEVFGYLKAVRDMDTFADTMQHTAVKAWYEAMEIEVGASAVVPPME